MKDLTWKPVRALPRMADADSVVKLIGGCDSSMSAGIPGEEEAERVVDPPLDDLRPMRSIHQQRFVDFSSVDLILPSERESKPLKDKMGKTLEERVTWKIRQQQRRRRASPGRGVVATAATPKRPQAPTSASSSSSSSASMTSSTPAPPKGSSAPSAEPYE